MKIGIIGAGKVGSVLGKRLAEKGYNINFGVRDVLKYAYLRSINNIEILDINSISKSNDILILTVPGRVAEEVLLSLGNLKGKTILDATNMAGMKNFMEKIPEANFVKVFNTIGYNIMENAKFGDLSADSFICGDDKKAIDIASQISIDLDFNPVIVGDSSFSGDLENLALLWIKMSRIIGRDFCFKMLKR